MSNSRSTTAAWIAVTFLAVALPPVQGLAQTPQAAQVPGGAQGGRGGGGRPQGDYNISLLRTAEEKALPNPYARDETFFVFIYRPAPVGWAGKISRMGSTEALRVSDVC